MNFNVNFNVLLGKYIVHPLLKIKTKFDQLTYVCIKYIGYTKLAYT